ncbi:hypothetical protein C2S51_031739 [Perilla frutescens var. frutescens]|nr:hypothetical protein C2S51_031739 [Perilla frutescens var. frutescens]
MAQFLTIYCLLLITSLISVNYRHVDGDEACYRVVPNVPCEGAALGKSCLPECVKLCGRSTLGVCVRPDFEHPPMCACSFVMKNCSDLFHRPC